MTGTPTFVIDGKVYGGELTTDQLKAILDPLIKVVVSQFEFSGH
jgi:protein-disulfide isomerase